MTRIAFALSVAAGYCLWPAAAAPAKKAAKEKAAQTASAPPPPPSSTSSRASSSGACHPMTSWPRWSRSIEGTFAERLKKTATDPARQDRVRKEMRAEIDKAKSKLVKFDGQKSGYDVSIIDQEFLHNSGESMLVAKEDDLEPLLLLRRRPPLQDVHRLRQGDARRASRSGIRPADAGQVRQGPRGLRRARRPRPGVNVKLDHYVGPTRAATSCAWSTGRASTTSTAWSSTTATWRRSSRRPPRPAHGGPPGRPGRGRHHPAGERAGRERQRHRPHHRPGVPQARATARPGHRGAHAATSPRRPARSTDVRPSRDPRGGGDKAPQRRSPRQGSEPENKPRHGRSCRSGRVPGGSRGP